MDASCGIRRFARRLVVVLLATSAVAMFASAPALAQSLGSLDSGSPAGGGSDPVGTTVSNLVQASAPVTQTVTPTVQAAATPLAQVAAPIAQTTAAAAAPIAQTAAPVTAPVAGIATPVVQNVSAPLTQATAPIVQAAAPILEAAAPVVEPLTASVVESTSSLLGGYEQALVVAGPLTGSSGSASRSPGGQDAPSVPGASTVDEPAPVGTTALGTPITADLGDAHAGPSAATPPARGIDSRSDGRSAQPVLPIATTHLSPGFTSGADTSAAGAPKGIASARPAPDPSSPSAPAGSGSVAAAFSGSGASIFVAALAAALLLAVPGLSRRLRLELASWPLPVPLPSLERPG